MHFIDYLHDHDFSNVLDFIIVGFGGAMGAMSRFGVRHLGMFDDNPYYYTVAINLTGCLIIGIIGALFTHFKVGSHWTYFVIVGFLGGYTTYSAFALDAIELLNAHMWKEYFIYLSLVIIGGLGLCALGFFGVNRILKLIAS